MSYYYILNYFKTHTIEEVATFLGITLQEMQKLIENGLYKIIRVDKDTICADKDIIRISPWSLEIGMNRFLAKERDKLMRFVGTIFDEAHWTYDLNDLCHILNIDKKVAMDLLHCGDLHYTENDGTITIHPRHLFFFLLYREEFNQNLKLYKSQYDESKNHQF